MDGDHGQARELRLEALRRVQNQDFLVILEVKFLEEGGHGF
jgi:hypothetical protein